jgi:hypothetical protein
MRTLLNTRECQTPQKRFITGFSLTTSFSRSNCYIYIILVLLTTHESYGVFRLYRFPPFVGRVRRRGDGRMGWARFRIRNGREPRRWRPETYVFLRIVERAIRVIPEIVTIKLGTFFRRGCLIENRRRWAGAKNRAKTLMLASRRLKKPSGLPNSDRIIVWTRGKSTVFFIIIFRRLRH